VPGETRAKIKLKTPKKMRTKKKLAMNQTS